MYIADASETPAVRNSKAETELLAVLADRERKLGKDNPLTLATMNALGLIYKHQGRYQEAEALYTRALEASERALGNEHPLTASIGQNLAAIQKAQSRPREGFAAALEELKRVNGARQATAEIECF